MNHAKLLDVLTALPVSQSILPRVVCFATSRPASHAICICIDSSGYASGPIRRCLFIDYIIMYYIVLLCINIYLILTYPKIDNSTVHSQSHNSMRVKLAQTAVDR